MNKLIVVLFSGLISVASISAFAEDDVSAVTEAAPAAPAAANPVETPAPTVDTAKDATEKKMTKHHKHVKNQIKKADDKKAEATSDKAPEAAK